MRVPREKLVEAVIAKLDKGENYEFWLGYLARLEEEEVLEEVKPRLFPELQEAQD
jgi:hypothetical protein